MLLERERDALVQFARRLEADGLSSGTAGNLSARAGALVAITPSGIPYDQLEPELICVVGLDGTPAADGPRPSSELPLHLALYRHHGAGAVVHTHPPYATAVSAVLDELPAIHYLAAELGGPVRVAPYALFGTDELALAAAEALAGRHAVLLAAHGAVTVGDTVAHAYARSLHLEWLARLHAIACTIGTPRTLGTTEVEAVAARLEALAYGPARTTSPPRSSNLP